VKYLILLNAAPHISEFLAKLSNIALKNGDTITIYVSSKFAEKKYLKLFPENAKIIRSWELDNTCDTISDNTTSELDIDFPWKVLYPSWDRKQLHRSLFKFNYEISTRILSGIYKRLKSVILKEQPDVILQEPPSNLLTMIAKLICKKYNMPYVGLIVSRIPGYIDVWDDYYTNSNYINDFKKELTKKEINYYNHIAISFAQEDLKPEYLRAEINNIHELNFFSKYLKTFKNEYKIRWNIIKNIRKYKKMEIPDYESIVAARSTFIGPAKFLIRKMRANMYSSIFSKPYYSDDYFVFPLHLQPEASTSAQAPFYSDLVSTIRYVAFSLPYPYKLFVKEHPSAIGTRSRQFYNEIKKIPNVVLMTPKISNYELITHSRGVITLTSTLGLQAALLGRKVFVLGDVFYSYHPSVMKINSIYELEKALLEHKTLEIEKKHTLDIINAKFMYSYLANAFKGSFFTEKLDYTNFKLLIEKKILKKNK